MTRDLAVRVDTGTDYTSDVVRVTRHRTAEIFAELQQRIFRDTDRLFAVLMTAQWVFGIVVAYWVLPTRLGRTE